AGVTAQMHPSVAFHVLNHMRTGISRLEAKSEKKITIRGNADLALDELRIEYRDARDRLVELGPTPPNTPPNTPRHTPSSPAAHSAATATPPTAATTMEGGGRSRRPRKRRRRRSSNRNGMAPEGGGAPEAGGARDAGSAAPGSATTAPEA
ncbi:MAG: hypothetical protein JXA69_02450, partial [Phycisphaerae bacterium]|nr:hypothetical protein [Phycisphaerae bacterium]